MKTFFRFTMIALLMGFAQVLFAQDSRNLQFFRPVGQEGLNVFETSKADTAEYDGVKVRVGGDFALQFQGLSQSNNAEVGSGYELVELGNNFNLPTANLNLDVQMYDGVRLHLRTYLSSRHHAEAWVKGGHLQIDKLDFISEGFMEGLMEYTTITVGLDEFNYGDAHFRRSDNARAIYNPFVGNYIMDAFSTEAFGEVTVQNNGLLAVIGVTNGKLNQSATAGPNNKPSFYGKLGFDKQFSDDFRARLTGSWYINTGTGTGGYLYGGDRAGARYYNVMHSVGNDDLGVGAKEGFADPQYNPRFSKIGAFQINPFIKAGGFEFFGIYEVANGLNEGADDGSLTQIAAEALYRFGANERYYIGGRFNSVKGAKTADATEDLDTNRINFGGGWFLTDNIMTKVEYVNQQYNGDAWGGQYAGAGFKGLMLEAAISF
ncbi:hypothetical protein QYS49_33270 [Marivirga salinae]|uniref:Porin n=1 Tax=Marivirga salinarum TaxID=3059078 RepID=A0AA51NBQ1_9BACT|nr:hypothetical protein [Marivirga sp. BDSF4-3]WMN12334.1 hypothetical protein QYS49_33270 [Marivirga sp. BDSF4-3]